MWPNSSKTVTVVVQPTCLIVWWAEVDCRQNHLRIANGAVNYRQLLLRRDLDPSWRSTTRLEALASPAPRVDVLPTVVPAVAPSGLVSRS